MSSTLINQLDRIATLSDCRMSIEEIAEFVFGGFMGRKDRKQLMGEVVQAGIQLRKSQGLPLAIPIPQEVGFFLIVWGTEWLSDDRIHKGEKGIGEVQRQIKKIERKHGIKDSLSTWRVGEGPKEWETANEEWSRIANEIYVDTLKQHGLADIAALFVQDIKEFDRRREIGRKNLAKLVGREDVLEGMPGS